MFVCLTITEKILVIKFSLFSFFFLIIYLINEITGEAGEIHKVNPWLTYGEPLHRFREFGAINKELDLIDEGLLGKEQMRQVCAFM